MDATQAVPPAGSDTAAAPAIASPAVPPASLTIMCPTPPFWPFPPLADPLLVLPGQHGCDPHWQPQNHGPAQRFPVCRKSIWWTSILLYQAPAPLMRQHQIDDCEDRPWCPGQHHPLSNYQKLFPHKIDDSKAPSANLGPSGLPSTLGCHMMASQSPC